MLLVSSNYWRQIGASRTHTRPANIINGYRAFFEGFEDTLRRVQIKE